MYETNGGLVRYHELEMLMLRQVKNGCSSCNIARTLLLKRSVNLESFKFEGTFTVF